MFSLRIVNADHYLAAPLPRHDPVYSEFRGFAIQQVPVIRIFGITDSGKKACLHVHGVFPYVYVPYDGNGDAGQQMYQLASSLDKALNISLGSSNSTRQHVFKIVHVAGLPFYGYHAKNHQFFKIYFYNPLLIKKATDLLQNGAVCNKVFQCHEAHLPFILQFFIDYNLYGMSFIDLAAVAFRDDINLPESLVEGEEGRPSSMRLVRTTYCEIEADSHAENILNNRSAPDGEVANPGLAGIWADEKKRHKEKFGTSQFTPQLSQTRTNVHSTLSEILLKQKLKDTIEQLSASYSTRSNVSVQEEIPYAAELDNGLNLLDASVLNTQIRSNSSLLTVPQSKIEGEESIVDEQTILSLSQADAPVPHDYSLLDMMLSLAERGVDDGANVTASQHSTQRSGPELSQQFHCQNLEEDSILAPSLLHHEDEEMFAGSNSTEEISDTKKVESTTSREDELWEDTFWNDVQTGNIPQVDGAFDEPEEKNEGKRYCKNSSCLIQDPNNAISSGNRTIDSNSNISMPHDTEKANSADSEDNLNHIFDQDRFWTQEQENVKQELQNEIFRESMASALSLNSDMYDGMESFSEDTDICVNVNNNFTNVLMAGDPFTCQIEPSSDDNMYGSMNNILQSSWSSNESKDKDLTINNNEHLKEKLPGIEDNLSEDLRNKDSVLEMNDTTDLVNGSELLMLNFDYSNEYTNVGEQVEENISENISKAESLTVENVARIAQVKNNKRLKLSYTKQVLSEFQIPKVRSKQQTSEKSSETEENIIIEEQEKSERVSPKNDSCQVSRLLPEAEEKKKLVTSIFKLNKDVHLKFKFLLKQYENKNQNVKTDPFLKHHENLKKICRARFNYNVELKQLEDDITNNMVDKYYTQLEDLSKILGDKAGSNNVPKPLLWKGSFDDRWPPVITEGVKLSLNLMSKKKNLKTVSPSPSVKKSPPRASSSKKKPTDKNNKTIQKIETVNIKKNSDSPKKYVEKQLNTSEKPKNNKVSPSKNEKLKVTPAKQIADKASTIKKMKDSPEKLKSNKTIPLKRSSPSKQKDKVASPSKPKIKQGGPMSKVNKNNQLASKKTLVKTKKSTGQMKVKANNGSPVMKTKKESDKPKNKSSSKDKLGFKKKLNKIDKKKLSDLKVSCNKTILNKIKKVRKPNESNKDNTCFRLYQCYVPITNLIYLNERLVCEKNNVKWSFKMDSLIATDEKRTEVCGKERLVCKTDEKQKLNMLSYTKRKLNLTSLDSTKRITSASVNSHTDTSLSENSNKCTASTGKPFVQNNKSCDNKSLKKVNESTITKKSDEFCLLNASVSSLKGAEQKRLNSENVDNSADIKPLYSKSSNVYSNVNTNILKRKTCSLVPFTKIKIEKLSLEAGNEVQNSHTNSSRTITTQNGKIKHSFIKQEVPCLDGAVTDESSSEDEGILKNKTFTKSGESSSKFPVTIKHSSELKNCSRERRNTSSTPKNRYKPLDVQIKKSPKKMKIQNETGNNSMNTAASISSSGILPKEIIKRKSNTLSRINSYKKDKPEDLQNPNKTVESGMLLKSSTSVASSSDKKTDWINVPGELFIADSIPVKNENKFKPLKNVKKEKATIHQMGTNQEGIKGGSATNRLNSNSSRKSIRNSKTSSELGKLTKIENFPHRDQEDLKIIGPSTVRSKKSKMRSKNKIKNNTVQKCQSNESSISNSSIKVSSVTTDKHINRRVELHDSETREVNISNKTKRNQSRNDINASLSEKKSSVLDTKHLIKPCSVVLKKLDMKFVPSRGDLSDSGSDKKNASISEVEDIKLVEVKRLKKCDECTSRRDKEEIASPETKLFTEFRIWIQNSQDFSKPGKKDELPTNKHLPAIDKEKPCEYHHEKDSAKLSEYNATVGDENYHIFLKNISQTEKEMSLGKTYTHSDSVNDKFSTIAKPFRRSDSESSSLSGIMYNDNLSSKSDTFDTFKNKEQSQKLFSNDSFLEDDTYKNVSDDDNTDDTQMVNSDDEEGILSFYDKTIYIPKDKASIKNKFKDFKVDTFYSVDDKIDVMGNREVLLVPKLKPPSSKEVSINSTTFNLPTAKCLDAFYSDPLDKANGLEIGCVALKLKSHSVADLDEYEGLYTKGVSYYRNTIVLNLCSGSSDIQGNSILASERCLTLVPIRNPPSQVEVRKWLKIRNNLRKVEEQTECKKVEVQRLTIPLSPEQVCRSDDEQNEMILSPASQTSYSGDSISSTQTAEESCGIVHSTPSNKAPLKLTIASPSCTPVNPQLCSNVKKRKLSGVRRKASLKILTNYSKMPLIKEVDTVTQLPSADEPGMLAESNTLQSLEKSQSSSIISEESRHRIEAQLRRKPRLSSSYQLEGVTLDNSGGFKVDVDNLQQTRPQIQHQFLTIMALEIHVQTRGDLRPDPDFDAIRAVFYHITNDVPSDSSTPDRITGIIVVGQLDSVVGYQNTADITCVTDEHSLFTTIIQLVRKWDPDIFLGFEIETLSWGYVIQRAYILNMNFNIELSRVRGTEGAAKYEDEKGMLGGDGEELDIRLAGRIILNVWRLLRHEVALMSYSFENIMYHVLHRRIPLFSFRNLTTWWEHRTSLYRWMAAEHYITRVKGVIELLEHLDLIGRTSELARLFGIQFYEVLSRGSQFRVESMMLRMAKPKNYVAVSPSTKQRARMRAPESLPLIMEPESRLYNDPVIVLDFQSLYPSIIIAYNYCYSTCLGRVEHLAKSELFEFGCTQLQVPFKTIMELEENINFSPCGVAFVNNSIREGVLPRMLGEILETRLMVKKSMKQNKENKSLQRVLHNRQLGLKLIANVTYGYTSANFSGRMPCIEIGDSVVSKGRETLERAIALVNKTTRWGARVVYGDTDSLFVLVPGKSRKEAFEIGAEIADAVTNDNPKPVKLKLEKVYHPCILQTKKRYVGYMYEGPDQVTPVYDAKGIETVRRDGCPAVAKILQKSLELLFETKDVSTVKKYVNRQFTKLLTGRVSIQELTFAREYRGAAGYRPGACVPGLELTREWMKKDRRAEPRVGERVPYVIVSGPPGLPLIRLVRCPRTVLADPSLKINSEYYITRVIIPPLNRCFSLVGANVINWYVQMPKRQQLCLPSTVPAGAKKGTISQYFATVNCVVCQNQTQTGVCVECQCRPQTLATVLATKLNSWERRLHQITKVCQSCCGRPNNTECISLDCPVFYARGLAKRDMSQESFIRQLQADYLTF